MNRPPLLYVLTFAHVVLGLNALYGGGALIVAPDGSLLQLPLAWIEGTPFSNYILPGIILFLLMGVIPLYTSIALLIKPNVYLPEKLNMFKDKHWSWAFSLYIGISTQFWIIIQQLLTSYFMLQPIISSLGLGIVILTLFPSVQLFFKKN